MKYGAFALATILALTTLAVALDWSEIKTEAQCANLDYASLASPIITAEATSEDLNPDSGVTLLCNKSNTLFAGVKTAIKNCEISGSTSEKTKTTLTLLDDQNKLVAYAYPGNANMFNKYEWSKLKKASEKANISTEFGGAVVNQQEEGSDYCISPLNQGRYTIEIANERDYAFPVTSDYNLSVVEMQVPRVSFEIADGKSKIIGTDYGKKIIQYTYDCGLKYGDTTVQLKVFDQVEVSTKIIIKTTGLAPIQIVPQIGMSQKNINLAVSSGNDQASSEISEQGPITEAKIFSGNVYVRGKVTNWITKPGTYEVIGANIDLLFYCPSAGQILKEGTRRGSAAVCNFFAPGAACASPYSPDFSSLSKAVNEKGRQRGGKILSQVSAEQEKAAEAARQAEIAGRTVRNYYCVGCKEVCITCLQNNCQSTTDKSNMRGCASSQCAMQCTEDTGKIKSSD